MWTPKSNGWSDVILYMFVFSRLIVKKAENRAGGYFEKARYRLMP